MGNTSCLSKRVLKSWACVGDVGDGSSMGLCFELYAVRKQG